MPASADPSTWPGALIDEAAGARRAAAPLMPRSLFVKGGEPWASAAPPVPLDIVFTVAGTGRCHPVGVASDTGRSRDRSTPKASIHRYAEALSGFLETQALSAGAVLRAQGTPHPWSLMIASSFWYRSGVNGYSLAHMFSAPHDGTPTGNGDTSRPGPSTRPQ